MPRRLKTEGTQAKRRCKRNQLLHRDLTPPQSRIVGEFFYGESPLQLQASAPHPLGQVPLVIELLP